jgi:hypothetical protein
MRFLKVARVLATALCLSLSACSWTPAAIYDHVSDPGTGKPFNVECEDTSDFVGLGAGQAWDHERGSTRVYIAGGTKRFRVCVNEMRPADVRDEPAGQLLVIREFELKR